MEWILRPYRRYADFEGRSRRLECMGFMLFLFGVFVLLHMVFGQTVVVRRANGVFYSNNLTGWAGVVGDIIALGSLIPFMAVGARRMHDQDKSGALMWLVLIPVLGWFTLFVLFLLEGTRGPNRFGPDPKNPDAADVFS